MTEPSTLVDLLRSRAQTEADRLAYTFLEDGDGAERSVTYGLVDRAARTVAGRLQEAGATGQTVLLLYPSGLDYISAFFGCLYAGAIAVPAYPPRRNRSLDRIDGIVTNSGATYVLATQTILDDLEMRFSEHPHLQAMSRIATDAPTDGDSATWTDPGVTGADLAFLQYTSGSTDRPKGVMVSHDNLLHNERLIGRAFGMNESDIVLGWLPLYHDMGLIGNVLQALYAGVPCILMPPTSFLQKPIRWLEAISRFGATVSGGPNFAYDLCVRNTTPEQREGISLESWKVAFNGSEPVRSDTIGRFSDTFAAYGFRQSSFFPCYGLAEATLFVTGGPRESGPEIVKVDAGALGNNRIRIPEHDSDESSPLVSSGKAWEEQRLCILDPETMELRDDDEIGEIGIAGESVAGGYWKQADATDRAFLNDIKDIDNGQVLRTGDLGFLRDGQLYVTGRLKDLIIIRGRNHYPHDIESTVTAAHPDLRGGRGAAFGIDIDGEERLAVAHEVSRSALRNLDADVVRMAIRSAVSVAHELDVHRIALLRPGSLPITTSGKVQRGRAKAEMVGETLKEVRRPAPAASAPSSGNGAVPPGDGIPAGSNGLVARLQQHVAASKKVQVAAIDPEAPLSSFGFDSLDLAQLRATIESEYQMVAPPLEDLLDVSVSGLAAMISDQGGSGDGEAPASREASPSDVFAKCDTEGGYFGKYRRAKDKYFTQPVLEGPIGPRMQFEGREVITWSINNYLGLAGDPDIHERARRTVETHGPWTPMGSRLMTGNSNRHMALEARLARFVGKEASVVFNYGYMGVIGTIHSLVDEADTVLIDSLSHACIVDGALLASRGKQFRVFRHNDMESLEEQLKAANANRRGGLLLVTEGLYGMTGDQAPLAPICDLKDLYEARLLIDDAHGFGVMGPTGAGTAEHQGVQDRVDLYFGTFAKSFAAIGGVTAGDERVVDYIRYNARPNIFAKSLPMIYVEAVDAALDLVEKGSDRREQVWHIAHRLQAGLSALGYDLGSTDSPITPVYIPAGSEETAVRAIRLMRSTYGIFVSAVTYPVVPRGVVLFRLTATAAHTDDDVDRTLEAFEKLRNDLDLELAPEKGTAP